MIGVVCWTAAKDALPATGYDGPSRDDPRCRRVTRAAFGAPVAVIAPSISAEVSRACRASWLNRLVTGEGAL